MKIKTLTSIYLKNNHIKSLRHELCEIIYKDYKGTTFFLSQMLEDKERVLEDINNFIKTHPEIYNFKENSLFYYPYENVNKEIEPYLYFDFYIDNDNNAVHFGKKGEMFVSDYLLDPLKIQFSIMAKDISQMDIDSDVAKKVINLN
jgi:small-conductance mechanosensitive channel